MPDPGEQFSVRGRTVVVTGGTRGIGLMMARGFVSAGATVLVTSRKADACAAAEEELGTLGGCFSVPADLGTPAGVETVLTKVAHEGLAVDVVVNNAGAVWSAPVDDYPLAAFDKLWALNVRGPFALIQGLLPALRSTSSPDRPSTIINIGSIDALRVPPFDTFAYSASKSALHMLTQHLALTLAADHITVNAIAPGPFHTRMMAAVLDDPQTGEEIRGRTPLGRLGNEQDAAGLAVFLASPAAAWVTGAIVPLDGGLRLRG